MEHLPLPTQRSSQTKPIFPAIPYRCRQEYDRGTFLDYPQRSGLLPRLEVDDSLRFSPSLKSYQRRLLLALPAADLQAFLQTWLFFGLLHEVLGDLYCHDAYVVISTNEGVERRVVSTVNLHPRLKEWEVKIKKQDEGSIMAVYKHLARCLNLTWACLAVEYPAFDDNLRFHLISVAELLGYAANKACDVAWSDSPSRTLLPVHWGTNATEGFRRSILLDRSNCCPSKIPMLMEAFKSSPQALSFAAACILEDGFQLDHSSCDERSCRLEGSAISSKVPHHVSETCECKLLSVDERLLADCLESGCIPLLRINNANDLDQISIDVVASKEGSTPYLALSHVWADGLGNPKGTALPRCQLSRLKTLIDNLDFEYLPKKDGVEYPENTSDMLFWCDTLCCPVHLKEAQKTALTRMYRTYAEASVVLVLDKSLIVSNREGRASVIQACLRVATSRWMTRLWTLQEGALPARKNRLWFQFTMTALPLWSLLTHLRDLAASDIQWRGVVDGVTGRLNTFMHLFDITSVNESQGAQLKDISRGLLYRAVTVSSDEPLIIATLLSLDIRRILSCKPRKRMIMLWRMIAESLPGVDKDVLFHTVPGLKRRGFRWAPQSLLYADIMFARPVPDGPKNRAFLSKVGNIKGLVGELAGFRINIIEHAKKVLPKELAGFDSLPKDDNDRYRLLLQDAQGRWYFLRHRQDVSGHRPSASEDIYAMVSKLKAPWILYRGKTSSCIPDRGNGHPALLVEAGSEQNQLQESDITCVEIKSQVDFCHVPSDIARMCRIGFILAQRLASSAAARAVADFNIARTETSNPAFREACRAIDDEVARLSRGIMALNMLTSSSGDIVDDSEHLRLGEYIERMYRGIYLNVEDYSPGDRKWCVD